VKILSGPNAGDGYRVHQRANDWIMANLPGGGRPVIAKPGTVELTAGDVARFEARRQRRQDDQRAGGQFWVHWQLEGNRLTLTEADHAELARRATRRSDGHRAPRLS
jgi:hypothetical protein